MNFTHIIPILVALLIALAGGPRAAHAGEHLNGEVLGSSVTRVTLRATVRLPADAQAVTLGDIARIEGPQTKNLQELTIGMDTTVEAGKWTSVTLDAIRERLSSAPAINDGSLIVAGSDTQVTRLEARDENKPRHARDLSEDAPAGPVLRDHIERWILARLGATPDATRIRFHENDAELLVSPTAGRIVEIGELGRSERMSLRIAVYENERIVTDTTLRVEVQIQREVRVSTTQIRRGSRISDATTTLETRWLAPIEPIAEPTESVGKVAKNTIDPGSILLVSMLKAPVVIERGQIVSARSISGSVSVSMNVRALSDGVVGELITLESRDRKQRFTARVAGPGQVLIVDNPESSTR